MTEPGTCKGCGAPIFWALTKDGKPMPCDPELQTVHILPDPPKVTLIGEDGVTRTGRRLPMKPEDTEVQTITGYVPHWSTCSRSKEFRKR